MTKVNVAGIPKAKLLTLLYSNVNTLGITRNGISDSIKEDKVAKIFDRAFEKGMQSDPSADAKIKSAITPFIEKLSYLEQSKYYFYTTVGKINLEYIRDILGKDEDLHSFLFKAIGNPSTFADEAYDETYNYIYNATNNVDISGDEIDLRLYMRDNGEDIIEKIEELKHNPQNYQKQLQSLSPNDKIAIMAIARAKCSDSSYEHANAEEIAKMQAASLYPWSLHEPGQHVSELCTLITTEHNEL